MPNEEVRLTREQLYELVWSRPMTEIAADFGMSSVAFAKYCKAADVPRPERGYWQQVISGTRVRKEPLRRPRAGALTEVIIAKYQRPSLGRRPPANLAPVAVADAIRFHPIVKELDALLSPFPHHQNLPTVRGFSDVVLKVSEATRSRALRLLHAVFVAVEARGYVVRLRRPDEHSQSKTRRRALEIVVEGEAIVMSLSEHLRRVPHVKTELEKRSEFFQRAFDLEPTGRLHLRLAIPWPKHSRTHWAVTDKAKLEDVVAEVAWAVDEAGRALVTHRAAVATEARRDEIIRRIGEDVAREMKKAEAEDKARIAEAEARAAYQRELERDLTTMADRWSAARNIRAFLAAVDAVVPAGNRNDRYAAWLAWARTHAARIDPLTEPQTIAKEITFTGRRRDTSPSNGT
jgi:hypothetical protein